MTDIAMEEWLTARWEGEHAAAREAPRSDYRTLRLIAQATRDRIANALLDSRMGVDDPSGVVAAR
ncbi:MAG TPA: hypothetical protein VH301_00560 [Usitatibacter sp.]|jgi:hypothetical protein|nr:hypothetical protein [Usitatibacter sp.]